MAAPIAATAAPVFMGLKLYEVLTLVGIILGPIFAVLITLGVEYRRSKRERRINLFRALLATFRTAGDANWSVAMNMLLIEFNDHKSVMDARREYMNTVRVKAPLLATRTAMTIRLSPSRSPSSIASPRP